MLKNTVASVVVTLLGAAAMSATAFAETATPPATSKKERNAADTAKKPAELSAVKQLELSSNLAKLGRANKDALQLIVAAQILQGASPKYEARKPDDAPASAVVGPEKADSVASLLDEAKALSKNDKTIVALADDVKASASKGRVGGGIISLGQIGGSTIHTRTINFQGGRFAEVGAVGIDTSAIMLEVFDQNGNLICRDTDPAYCSFNPIWTGPFTVRVHNDSSGVAHYKLETN
jgi:hypothetical protein